MIRQRIYDVKNATYLSRYEKTDRQEEALEKSILNKLTPKQRRLYIILKENDK